MCLFWSLTPHICLVPWYVMVNSRHFRTNYYVSVLAVNSAQFVSRESALAAREAQDVRIQIPISARETKDKKTDQEIKDKKTNRKKTDHEMFRNCSLQLSWRFDKSVVIGIDIGHGMGMGIGIGFNDIKLFL